MVKRVGKKPLRPLINKAVFEGLAEGQPVKSGGSLAPADTLPRTEGYRKIRHSLQKCVESGILKTEFAVYTAAQNGLRKR